MFYFTELSFFFSKQWSLRQLSTPDPAAGDPTGPRMDVHRGKDACAQTMPSGPHGFSCRPVPPEQAKQTPPLNSTYLAGPFHQPILWVQGDLERPGFRLCPGPLSVLG